MPNTIDRKRINENRRCVMSGEEQHRAASEAQRHVAARPVTAPGHEAGVARYLGAQHYRERRAHEQEVPPPAEQTDENPPAPEADDAVPKVP
jgi:hypothetical protein